VIASRSLPLSFSPDLVEEAVLAAIAGRPEERSFRRLRDPIYRLRAEEREAAFSRLHDAWFERLGIDEPLRQALDELPELAERAGRCVVSRALSRADETVDLLVAPEEDDRGGRSVLVRLRTSALADRARLLAWLRAELLKVVDMLDPVFGYEPTLPAGDDPAHERLARERYRAIWDASVTGRLARRGIVDESAIAAARRTFEAAFPMLGAACPESFQRFFDGRIRAHAAWSAFATAPHGPRSASLAPGGRCPLCRFPSYAPEAEPESLPASVVALIVSDFPTWTPGAGLCRQCADLYRAAVLSRQALAELPGAPRC
jgi:hypothetical protein